jgi:hypothetical protein
LAIVMAERNAYRQHMQEHESRTGTVSVTDGITLFNNYYCWDGAAWNRCSPVTDAVKAKFSKGR